MVDAKAFAVDPDRVVHETIDGEAILIDLETGVYHSLTGTGPEIWDLLLAGLTVEEVVGSIAARYRIEAAAVAPATQELVDSLCAAGVLTPTARNGAAPTAEAGPAGASYEPPALRTYTDMEYFLLLDPVHDVERSGWPHPKA